MSGPARTLGLAMLGLVVACATVGSREPAQLEVSVFSGAMTAPEAVPPVTGVEVLLDVTPSMTATLEGPSQLDAARQAASQFVSRLPDAAAVRVHALGSQPAPDGCGTSLVLGEASNPSRRGPLEARVARAAPRSEGSLAEALDRVRQSMAFAGEPTRRLVVFTDLRDECGGDICAAAAALAEQGTQLELVLFGDEPVPACLETLEPPSLVPAGFRDLPSPEALRFRVESAADSATVAAGTTQGGALGVAPGKVFVVFETDPPLRVGPIDLASGARTRVRLIDFPLALPALREWRWDTISLPEDAEG